MRILFTGGGTGGHFYPIIAIAQDIGDVVAERNLLSPELFYLAPTPYDPQRLFDLDITYHRVPAGKLRRYFSLLNVLDAFKTAVGIIGAIWHVFRIYPDVIFSKGGYASFPVVLAAKLFRIPLIIHESDATPGRVNAWASAFAQKIAISFAETASHFPKDRVAHTGNPIRDDLYQPAAEGAHEFLGLDPELPVILILGGSQGAQKINNAVLDALETLTERFQVIHQTGTAHIEEVRGIADVALGGTEKRARYKPFGYLDTLAMRMSAGAADLVVSRAGSTIFEIALWGKPAIVIPLPRSSDDHQRKNAFAYARAGAAEVMEEGNLTPHILSAEIERLMDDPDARQRMGEAAAAFAQPDAARTIAREIISIALAHEAE